MNNIKDEIDLHIKRLGTKHIGYQITYEIGNDAWFHTWFKIRDGVSDIVWTNFGRPIKSNIQIK